MRNSIFATILSFIFPALVFAETTIHITNGEWEPLLSEYSYQYGIDSHIVVEAFKLEGIKVVWGFFPWNRSYQIAKSGQQWQASCCWWPGKEAHEGFLISDAVSPTYFVFFHLKDFSFDWNSINDLQDYEVGATFAYNYGSQWDDAVREKKLKVQSTAMDEHNYKKLLHGRIQIFPNDPRVGYAQIRHNFPPEQAKLFTHHPKKFQESSINLIISKKADKAELFLKKFNTGLKKLKDSGKLAQMFKDLDAGKYDKQKDKWQPQKHQPND